MSLRPLLPGAAHNQVARSRMAPGGRVKPYSQSTIPRAGGVRRVRAVGTPPIEWSAYWQQVSTGGFTMTGYEVFSFSRYYAEGSDGFNFATGQENKLVRFDIILPDDPPDDDDLLIALVSDQTGAAVETWTIPGPHTPGAVWSTTFTQPEEYFGHTFFKAAAFTPDGGVRPGAWLGAWLDSGAPQGYLVYPADKPYPT